MAAVQPSAEIGQRAAAVRRDQLGVRITIEKARQDQPREGERGVDHEADRRRQTEFVEPHVAAAGRNRRVDEHRQAQPVDLRPDRREQRIAQVTPADVGERGDAERAVGAGAREFGQRCVRASQGIDATQRMRSGYFLWLSAKAALAIRAALALTAGVPQNTLGPVSDNTAISTPASSIARSRAS